jgi:hypothetical protein
MGVFSNPPIIEGPGPTDGQVPTWDESTGTWQSATPSGGGVGQVLMLSYYDGDGESDPFPVQCWGVPDGYDGGLASLGAQLVTGDGGIPSGVLLDWNGDPIPDGWTFPASIFVEGGIIFDIISFSGWTEETQGGIVVWGDEGGEPQLLYIPGGISSLGPIIFGNLPTSDPSNPGQLWNDLGTVKVSAG